jgi:hypothetical protein
MPQALLLQALLLQQYEYATSDGIANAWLQQYQQEQEQQYQQQLPTTTTTPRCCLAAKVSFLSARHNFFSN